MSIKGKNFEWEWSDPSHLDAHIRDFLIHPSELLESVYEKVAELKPDNSAILTALEEGEELRLQQSFELSVPIGASGLKNICKDESPSFWGYRIGRNIPSHLCIAGKELTNRLCLWGRWEPGKFIIHTLYPGEVAPREIHDPALPLEELQEAIDFWRCHAIVVNEGDYSLESNRNTG